MNKTININLAGIVFHMDEDAYKVLENYLSQLKTVFKNTEGREEIIADIEARFAELFKADFTEKSTVVTTDMVNKAIAVLGTPDMFVEEEDETHQSDNKQQNQSFTSKNDKKYRKLYRDADEAAVGGVCAGLANYLGTETWIIRVIFVAMVLFGIGSGILIYIILWIAVPEAKTTAQKLEMKGEPITASNIGKSVQEQFENLKKSVNNGNQKRNVGDFVEKLGNLILTILSMVFKVFVKLLGVAMLVMGIIIIVSIIASFFGMGSLFFNLLDTDWYGNTSISVLSDLFLISGNQASWIVISLALVLLIPLFQIIYAGLRIVFKVDRINPKITWLLTGIWVLGLITLIGNGIQLGLSYDDYAKYDKQMTLPLTSDTLTIKQSTLNQWNTFENEGFLIDGNTCFISDVKLNVVKSADTLAHIIIRKEARGWSKKEAQQRATKLNYTYAFNGNTLNLNNYISFDIDEKYRAQKLRVTVQIPEGKTVYLDSGTESIIYDISNIQNTWDGNMPNHHWQMTVNGLNCTDCLIQ